MFCTTLRQRGSIASIVPHLVDYGLKETRLTTHDFLLPIKQSSPSPSARATRTIRYLVLQPHDLEDPSWAATRSRIQRFASLTDPKDLAICFLLGTSSTSATMSSTEGVHAYVKLQCLLSAQGDVPCISVLLCIGPGDITTVVSAHSNGLTSRRPVHHTPSIQDLLSNCTTGPPLSDMQSNLVSDFFGSFKDLANACTAIENLAEAQRPLDVAEGDNAAVQNVQALRAQIGGEATRKIYKFWTQ